MSRRPHLSPGIPSFTARIARTVPRYAAWALLAVACGAVPSASAIDGHFDGGRAPHASARGAVEAAPDTHAARARYGYAARRPIIAGACRQCVWGPLAEFAAAALQPYGYQLQICYNCNEGDSPRYVAFGLHPHALRADEIALGDPPPPAGPVDLGVTEAQMLRWLYAGKVIYRADGPQHQLRLVAYIEDPVYVLIAAKKGSGITDLRQLRARKAPLRVLTDAGPWLAPIFRYYGITKRDVEARGGTFDTAVMAVHKNAHFDLLVSSLASIGNNLESNVWTEMSQHFDLVYFPLPPDLRLTLEKELGLVPVELPAHYFRGVGKPIATVGRSGEVIYGRADMPEEFAYDLAKAIDENRGRLKWMIRPFSYDARTVWKDGDVPLAAGAERYYREAGYLK